MQPASSESASRNASPTLKPNGQLLSGSETDTDPHPHSSEKNGLVIGELERLLRSRPLRDSDLLKRFLRYVVERTLAGEGDQLKEYRLGVEVFDRDPSFDPKLDPVVRMAARRLRSKLQEHYEREVGPPVVRIDVPKGSYAASFTFTADPSINAGGSEAPLNPQSTLKGRSTLLRVSIAVIALAAIAVIAGLSLRSSRGRASTTEPSSLAILPFLNLTGDPDNDYLGDGITEEITAAVATSSGLRVVARTSAFQFRGKPEDVREIGKRLNAASVLEGSVQNQNGHMRITAQLIRTSDGYHTWAKTYELQSKDTLAVENEIARSVSLAMNARLESEFSGRTRHQVDPVAHELYLRGEFARQRMSFADNQQGIVYFNQAIDRDPLYAEAYAAIAAAYSSQGASVWAPAKEVYPKARAAAQRAIELDPNLPDAVSTLANINFFYDWDFAAAEAGLRHALQLNPNSDKAHQWYGILLYYSRRFDEAREQFRLAKEVNPLAVQIDLTRMMLAVAEHRYDEAISLNRQILAENNNALSRLYLAWSLAAKKQYQDAIAEGQRGVAMVGNEPDANLALANIYVQAGERDKAMAIVRKYLEIDRQGGFIPPYTMAAVYAQLGQRDQMYAWLEQCVESRSPGCLKLDIGEPFDPYRSEPRFQEIRHKIGLPGQV